jgi:hypothetical protein
MSSDKLSYLEQLRQQRHSIDEAILKLEKVEKLESENKELRALVESQKTGLTFFAHQEAISNNSKIKEKIQKLVEKYAPQVTLPQRKVWTNKLLWWKHEYPENADNWHEDLFNKELDSVYIYDDALRSAPTHNDKDMAMYIWKTHVKTGANPKFRDAVFAKFEQYRNGLEIEYHDSLIQLEKILESYSKLVEDLTQQNDDCIFQIENLNEKISGIRKAFGSL